MDSVVGRIEGHIVPTSVVYRDDSFYVGNLDVFPIRDGASKVLKISRSGNISCIYIDLTVIPGLAFDRKGRCMVGEYDRKSDAHSRDREDSAHRWKGTVHGDCNWPGRANGDDVRARRESQPIERGFGPPPVGLGQVLKVIVLSD